MKINEKLKDRRKELGLTMLDIAKSVGVSEATISRWESGDIANMRRDKIVKLSKALNVTPDFIMSEDENLSNEIDHTYLTGYDNDKIGISPPANNMLCTPHEKKVIMHYRAKPEMQPAVDTLLGISDNEGKNTPAPQKHYPNIAAESGNEIKAKPLDIDTMIEIDKMK